MDFTLIVDDSQERRVSRVLMEYGMEFRQAPPPRPNRMRKTYFVLFETDREEVQKILSAADLRPAQYSLIQIS